MRTTEPAAALRELRSLVATYLEGSADALRAAELLDALDASAPVPAAPSSSMPDDQAIEMFGCTAEAIDRAIRSKDPRDIAMYAMGTLSNAQELIQRSKHDGAWTVTPASDSSRRDTSSARSPARRATTGTITVSSPAGSPCAVTCPSGR